jgi:hypothetical protein
MKRYLALSLAIAVAGCADFVDEDGNTSFHQVAQGLQSLGDRVSEFGEALERDADVEAVPWEDLQEVIPDRVDGVDRLDREGDEATDRNGAGMSIATAKFAEGRDSMFVGVADLGALRGGAQLALRWIAPVFGRDDIDGDVEELELHGYPAVRIRDDDGDMLVGLIVEGRFAVIAGSGARRPDAFIEDALDNIDYRQLRRWVDYGK